MVRGSGLRNQNFGSPESFPWAAATQLSKESMDRQHLPQNRNRYTQYHCVQAPYDTTIQPIERKTRFGRTFHKDTRNLIIPQDGTPSASNKVERVNRLVSLDDHVKEQQVVNARMERRRNYMSTQFEMRRLEDEKMVEDAEKRRVYKSMQREKYEKMFDAKNQRQKSRMLARKTFDKNLTFDQMKMMSRQAREVALSQ